NFKVLGSQLGKNMKEVALNIQKLPSETIATMLDGKQVTIPYQEGEISIGIDDIVVQRSELEDLKVVNEGQLTVGFDTKITHTLLLEGIARDIVRAVQNLRKEQGYDVADRVTLKVFGDAIIQEAFATFKDYIASETLAETAVIADSEQATLVPCGEDSVARITVTR
ncbi:MAG: DUF5915 domain-containing protein, partial [Sphaerochaetaceae bacterium]